MAQFQTTPVSQLADSYDAVIVGSGGTGLAAAIQAHELGMNVAVLEKEEQLGGNTNRASSGMNAAETNVQLKHGIIDNINDFYRETYKDGGRLNDKDMLGFFVVHSPLAIDWLADHGIKLEADPPSSFNGSNWWFSGQEPAGCRCSREDSGLQQG